MIPASPLKIEPVRASALGAFSFLFKRRFLLRPSSSLFGIVEQIPDHLIGYCRRQPLHSLLVFPFFVQAVSITRVLCPIRGYIPSPPSTMAPPTAPLNLDVEAISGICGYVSRTLPPVVHKSHLSRRSLTNSSPRRPGPSPSPAGSSFSPLRSSRTSAAAPPTASPSNSS